MIVKTLIQWCGPDDVWHEPGEVADVKVDDLQDLIDGETVAPVPEEPPATPTDVTITLSQTADSGSSKRSKFAAAPTESEGNG